MGEEKGDQTKLLFELRKCRNVLNLSEMPREDAVTRSTEPQAEDTKDAENPGEVPCPSNTLTKKEGTGQYISDLQVAKWLEIAEEQEQAAKVLTKLAGKIRSFIKDVCGPTGRGINWPPNAIFVIAMIIMVLVILIGVLIQYWLGSEPEEPVVPTWWEEVFAFAENLFNF